MLFKLTLTWVRSMGILLEQTDVWEARRYYYQAAKDDKKKNEIGLADAQFNLAMINSKIGNYKETLRPQHHFIHFHFEHYSCR